MTQTHLYPDGRPRWPVSLPHSTSKTDLSQEHSVSQRVGEEGRVACSKQCLKLRLPVNTSLSTI